MDKELLAGALEAWADPISRGYECPAAGQTIHSAATLLRKAIILTDEELSATRELGEKKELSDTAVIRQALRSYQRDSFRLDAGETVTWSGDAERARKFYTTEETRLEELAKQIEDLNSLETVESVSIRDTLHDLLPEPKCVQSPNYLHDIDAAIMLVPRGWIVSIVRHFNNDGEYWATVSLTDSFSVDRGCDPSEEITVKSNIVERWTGDDPTPRAVCAAAVRATKISQSLKRK